MRYHDDPDSPDAEVLRTFLEAMSSDPSTAQGGVAAYLLLDGPQRDAWITLVESAARLPGRSLGLGVLALLGAETDAKRQRRLLDAVAEPTFALRRPAEGGAWWRLVRPLGCDFASIATVFLADSGAVRDVSYEPFALGAFAADYAGVALADAVTTLAHAVVRAPDALRPALLPFVELFSPSGRVLPEVAA